MCFSLRATFILVAGLIGGAHSAQAAPSAPIFAYYQIGVDQDPSGNLRKDQFAAQLDLIARDHFNVMKLSDIVTAIAQKNDLPDKTIALTFDDAYRSVADNALPTLEQAGLTATIFVTPRLVDRGGDYMDWDDLRSAVKKGFSIGAKIDLDSLQSEEPDKVIGAVNQSLSRIRDELGVTPTLFSYAEGIADKSMREAVKSRNFAAGFGLQSGPASPQSDPYMMPRFPMTEAFGTLDRFRVAANALPLEVQDVLPSDPSIVSGANPPQIGFSVLSKDIDLKTLACFAEGQGKVPVETIGTRIEIRSPQPFDTDDTTRINCTAPATGVNSGRWYWLGFNYYVPAP